MMMMIKNETRLNSVLGFILLGLLLTLTSVTSGQTAVSQEDPIKFPNPNEAAELSAILSSPTSGYYNKTLACKLVARQGTIASVPVLVQYLNDPDLSQPVRIALLQLPGAEVDKAICDALPKVTNEKLIPGVLRTLGQRGNSASSLAIVPYLEKKNIAVFTAAADALGKIGDSVAENALKESWKKVVVARKNTLVTPLFAIAGKYVSQQKNSMAFALYSLVAAAKDISPRLRAAGIQGTIVTAPADQQNKLFENAFNSTEKETFLAALQTLSKVDSARFIDVLVKNFDSFDKDRKLTILTILRQQKNKSAVDLVLKIATTKGDIDIRNTALRTFGKLGDVSHAPLLFKSVDEARSGDWSVVVSILTCLGSIPDPEMDDLTLKMVRKNEGPFRSFMLDLARIRMLRGAIPDFLKEFQSVNKWERLSASQGCSAVMNVDDLPVLFEQLSGKTGDSRDKMIDAIRNIVNQSPDKNKAAQMIVDNFGKTDKAGQFQLFSALVATDQPRALAYLTEATNNSDVEVQDNAIRALGEWKSAAAAAPLLAAAKKVTTEKLQIRAVRAYIRIIRQMELAPSQRLDMSNQIEPLIRRDDERNLLLEALGRATFKPAFMYVLPWLEKEPNREAAASALVEIGKKVDVNDTDVQKGLKRVVEVSKNDGTKQMATDLLKGIVVNAR